MNILDHAIYVLNGREYRWSGWHGCQLESKEWSRVPAGTQRKIAGFDFRVFTTHREWLRYRTTWALAISGDLDYCNTRIRALQSHLRALT